MPKNYVLLPIAHGVELKQIQADYAEPLIDLIRSYLSDDEKNYLVPLPYNYTLKTHDRQLEMFNSVEAGLGNKELRRLKHTVGSDVTWSFITAKDSGDCFYRDFSNDMTNLIGNARVKYNGPKILCLGHSQGTQLFYSFFFDYHKIIDCFISLGSPISMNSGAYPDFGKVPSNLSSWINFYHDKDFISSRLQGVHPAKAVADFVVDYEVPKGWNPIYYIPDNIMGFNSFILSSLFNSFKAHTAYWKSKFVAKKIADKVKELMYQP